MMFSIRKNTLILSKMFYDKKSAKLRCTKLETNRETVMINRKTIIDIALFTN